jgi:hypothetical protein
VTRDPVRYADPTARPARGRPTLDRIQPLLEPSYAQGLDARSLDDLRAMRTECAAVETALSYYRRLAQGRVEILDAELERRRRGGTVEELIAKLPEILGDGGRSSAAQTRLADADPPIIELELAENRQQLVSDSTLVELPSLDDARIESIREEVAEFERELSELRRRLHGVLDGIEREIATRQAAGASAE